MSANLDAWITGNWGADHPDNQDPDPIRCRNCNMRFAAEDMSAQLPEDICESCYESGFRICGSCADPEHIDALRIPDWERGSGLAESWCDTCCENIVFDKPGLALWIENSFTEYQYCEASEAAVGRPLPERIELACIAHEWRFLPRSKREALTYPERLRYLRERAGELCERFAGGTESSFERNIWEAVTGGNFRK